MNQRNILIVTIVRACDLLRRGLFGSGPVNCVYTTRSQQTTGCRQLTTLADAGNLLFRPRPDIIVGEFQEIQNASPARTRRPILGGCCRQNTSGRVIDYRPEATSGEDERPRGRADLSLRSPIDFRGQQESLLLKYF